MGSEQRAEHGSRKKVSKLHFLIHPGFLSDFTDITRDQATLMDQYVNYARGMSSDELVIALLHVSTGELIRRHRKGTYHTDKMFELRGILGPRLITLSNKREAGVGSIFNPETYQFARKIALERGFEFDSDVPSEVYGETGMVCVTTGGEEGNKSLGLQRKTTIRFDLTDQSNISPSLKESLIRYSRMQLPSQD